MQDGAAADEVHGIGVRHKLCRLPIRNVNLLQQTLTVLVLQRQHAAARGAALRNDHANDEEVDRHGERKRELRI